MRSPPQKPLAQQWSGSFICGACHHKYTRRSSLKRHQVQCRQDFARQNGLVREARLRMGFLLKDDATMTQPQEKRKLRKPGRQPYEEHVCGKCERKFATARKRLDHQHCCGGQPVVVVQAAEAEKTHEQQNNDIVLMEH